MKRTVISALLMVCPVDVAIACDLSNYVGWTVIYSGTVTGHIDDDGEEQSSFNGCAHGRILIVDYTKTVTCNEYNYSYAYRPDIVVLSDGVSMRACIDDEMYSIHG